MSFKTKTICLDENYCQNNLGVKTNRYISLEVDDTGCVNTKLNPSSTTTDSGRSIGIDLSMVYGIAESHGAVLTYDTQPDAEASVELFFPVPRTDVKKTENKSARIEPAKQETETILLVDDEEPIQDFGKMILEKFGYDALIANSGENAIEIYKSKNQQIDLVVLDLNMPGMGGQKCLNKLVRINPDVKVVVASGFCPHDQVKQLLSEGATGYLQKPYMIKDILKSVREALGK